MGDAVLELVGMPGPWAENDSEPSDHYTTKIGGLPDWPIPQLLSSKPHLLRCATCEKDLCLVAQVYAPISGKNLNIDERVIYVLGCLTPTCGRNPCSWRAIRVQKLNPTDEEVVQETAVASSPVAGWNNDIWTEEGNDENDEDIDLEELGVALFEAASVASFSKKRHAKPTVKSSPLNTKPTVKSSPLNTKPTVKSSPLSPGTRLVYNDTPVLPCFYTYTEEELSSREIKKEQTQKAVSNEEAYEYTGAWNADRTYFRFRKCLDAYPEQCFRYSCGGKPLLAMEEVEDPGRCRHCGGSMHYEMQLTPALLYFLQERADDRQKHSLEYWTWLTVIVFTCSQSCFHPSDQEKSDNEGWEVAEEVIFIQYEKTVYEARNEAYFS